MLYTGLFRVHVHSLNVCLSQDPVRQVRLSPPLHRRRGTGLCWERQQSGQDTHRVAAITPGLDSAPLPSQCHPCPDNAPLPSSKLHPVSHSEDNLACSVLSSTLAALSFHSTNPSQHPSGPVPPYALGTIGSSRHPPHFSYSMSFLSYKDLCEPVTKTSAGQHR